jgi:hypothetical protein
VTFDSAGVVVAEQDLPSSSAVARADATRKRPTLLKSLHQSVSGGLQELKIRLTKAGVHQLRAKHRLTVKVRFIFTPTGGSAHTLRRSVTFKQPKKNHA